MTIEFDNSTLVNVPLTPPPVDSSGRSSTSESEVMNVATENVCWGRCFKIAKYSCATLVGLMLIGGGATGFYFITKAMYDYKIINPQVVFSCILGDAISVVVTGFGIVMVAYPCRGRISCGQERVRIME